MRHLASAGGSGANAYWFGQIRFNGSQASDLLIPRELLGDFAVQMTGNHYVVVANCDPRIQTLNVAGPVVALNPFGFLPAELYGFLPFYAAMTLIYVTVTLGWLVLVMMHSDQLLPVQLHITGVLLLSLVEMLTWYLDYVNFNEVGERRAAPFLVGICAAVLRRTVSRMLVIAVSLGYGVVRSDLGKSRSRLLAFGALYLVLECALEVWRSRPCPCGCETVFFKRSCISDSISAVLSRVPFSTSPRLSRNCRIRATLKCRISGSSCSHFQWLRWMALRTGGFSCRSRGAQFRLR